MRPAPVRTVLLAVAVIAAAGAAEAAGASGGAFLNVPLSVRQMGMGNVSLGGNDVLAGWSNPALLGGIGTRGEVAVNGASMFEGEQTAFGLGAGWLHSPNLAVGGYVSSFANSVEEIDEYGDPVGTSMDRSLMSVGLTGVYRFLDMVRLGVGAKFVSDSVVGESVGSIAADAGVAVAPIPGLVVGAAIRNVGPTLRAADGSVDAETLPTEIRAGVSYRIAAVNVGVGGEFISAANRDGRIGLGVDYWPVKVFGVRAGLSGVSEEQRQITFGLSGAYGPVRLDYAMATHDLGPTHRVSLAYAFGQGAGEFSEGYSDIVAAKKKAREERRAARAREKAEARAAEEEAVAEAEAEADTPKKTVKKDGKRTNLAIIDLEAHNVSKGDAVVATDWVRTELVQSGVYNIIEKSSMERVLAEQAFQQTGCTSEECAVKMGKLLNAKYMLVGSFAKFLDDFVVNARVVNVENGQVVFAGKAKGKSGEAIEKSIARLCKDIVDAVK